MKIGLVGFPGSGKTTVFSTLTGRAALAPHGGGREKTNLGVVKVPDRRVEELARLYNPRKTTFAEITFSDVAAAAVGAHTQGLDAASLQVMREMDALCQVVRGFADATGKAAAPLGDVQALEVGMNLADLILIEKRLERLHKERGKPSEVAALARMKAHLESGKPLRELEGLADADWALVTGFRLLSQKPLLLVLNVDEAEVAVAAPA